MMGREGYGIAVAASLASSFLTFILCQFLFSKKKVILEGESEEVEVRDDRRLEAEEEIMKEQLARNIVFLGEEKVERIRKSFVIVVGLGGVGGQAAAMLVRNGVGKIRLIDFDQVTLSSLNRHVCATRYDVGLSKTKILKDYFQKISPSCIVETEKVILTAENCAELLQGNPDYVLDCIDNIDTKVALLSYCKKNNIKVMASMGAGAKSDPSRILVADISETSNDPLSRVVRRGLKKNGIESGIPTVFSEEVPKIKLQPLDDDQFNNLKDFQLIQDFRIRILPVLGPLPCMFGNAMSAYLILALSGEEVPHLHSKNREEHIKKLFQQYLMRERDHYKTNPKDIPISIEDVSYVVEEIWRNRSGISGSLNHLSLIRWDRNAPPSTHNLVLMTVTEAKKHQAIQNLQEYPIETVTFIEEKLKVERQLDKLRNL